tara:strand:- start:117 stop:428 length:312 start_codon:yes stop_codon:yes gene_type:complete
MKPYLVEPGVKYFLNETLNNCSILKDKHYNLIFNFIIVIVFFIILGIILYYRYKGKISPKEKKEKEIKKQQYIMSKIRNYHASKKTSQITGLPEFTYHKDIIY